MELGIAAVRQAAGQWQVLTGEFIFDITGWPLVPGAMIAVVALFVLPVLFTMPETAHPRGQR